jgi:uncharacterized YccA/Bax inhibitor family protein
VVIAMLLYQFRILKSAKLSVRYCYRNHGHWNILFNTLNEVFGIDIPFVHGLIVSIIFHLAQTIAALNLILDFDKIETGSQQA